MDRDEKLKFLMEQSIEFHKIFIDFRNRLLAGLLVVISAISYFLFTWVEIPENYSKTVYILVCSCGALCTLLLFFINIRTTNLVREIQNSTFLIENSFINGLNNENNKGNNEVIIGPYGSFVNENVQKSLIKKSKDIKKSELIIKEDNFFNSHLNPLKHTGSLNIFFLIIFFVFIGLLFRTDDLYQRKLQKEKNIYNNLESNTKSDTLKTKSDTLKTKSDTLKTK